MTLDITFPNGEQKENIIVLLQYDGESNNVSAYNFPVTSLDAITTAGVDSISGTDIDNANDSVVISDASVSTGFNLKKISINEYFTQISNFLVNSEEFKQAFISAVQPGGSGEGTGSTAPLAEALKDVFAQKEHTHTPNQINDGALPSGVVANSTTNTATPALRNFVLGTADVNSVGLKEGDIYLQYVTT